MPNLNERVALTLDADAIVLPDGCGGHRCKVKGLRSCKISTNVAPQKPGSSLDIVNDEITLEKLRRQYECGSGKVIEVIPSRNVVVVELNRKEFTDDQRKKLENTIEKSNRKIEQLQKRLRDESGSSSISQKNNHRKGEFQSKIKREQDRLQTLVNLRDRNEQQTILPQTKRILTKGHDVLTFSEERLSVASRVAKVNFQKLESQDSRYLTNLPAGVESVFLHPKLAFVDANGLIKVLPIK